MKKQVGGIRITNLLELITGLYTVALSIYPYPVWFVFIIGVVPIISFAIGLVNRTLNKKIKNGVVIVLFTIALTYIYVLISLSTNLTSTLFGVLGLGLTISLITFITKLFD